jgi:arabinosyltransferase A
VDATLAGIACWLVIGHWVLRRLGPGKGGLGASRVAVFTAGSVFLAAWLPFNNGLRPEPLIALGVVVTWMLVERAIALQRLAPAAVAIVVATLTATLAPQGLIAIAALLTGARAIAQTIRRRRPTDGCSAAKRWPRSPNRRASNTRSGRRSPGTKTGCAITSLPWSRTLTGQCRGDSRC